MAKQKYYVVWKGWVPGVYTSWPECEKQIKNFPEAQYKSFADKILAQKAFCEGKDFSDMLFLVQQNPTDRPLVKSICVDAACSGNPGLLEYRGVDTATRKEIFRAGPFQYGTNNIGEFLGIVHALALLKKQGHTMPVYSDSATAIGWVKKKKPNTKLERTAKSRDIFLLMERAVKWLKENTYPNRILKWETHRWGENPADFGRK